MKKALTLLIVAASLAGTVHAQTNDDARRVILGPSKKGGNTTRNDNPRDVVLGNGDRPVYDENGNRYPDSRSSRQAEIDATNRDYDRRIQAVRNNPFLSAAEKDRRIRDLQYERSRRIREINNAYGRNRNDRRYDDDDDRKYKKEKKYKNKGNNGNHYGWQKGKGNPHRDRDRDDD